MPLPLFVLQYFISARESAYLDEIPQANIAGFILRRDNEISYETILGFDVASGSPDREGNANFSRELFRKKESHGTTQRQKQMGIDRNAVPEIPGNVQCEPKSNFTWETR
ncbi:hypothetical protein AAE478_000578 [Parahypoxylon ruwenzoriense]